MPEEAREEVGGDAEAVLLPHGDGELAVALVDVVREDPQARRELGVGKVERLQQVEERASQRQALDELRADGTLAEISDTYFGEDVSQ